MALLVVLVACGADNQMEDAVGPATPGEAESGVVDAVAPPTPGEAEPETVHVSLDSSSDYATLEAAVEAVASDSTIILDAGRFEVSASVIITKSLTIRGAGVDLTTISKNSPSGSIVLGFEGEHLMIQDLTLERTGDLAGDIMLVFGGEVSLEDCRLTGGARSEDDSITGTGLWIANEAVATVSHCSFEENMNAGILVTSNATATIEQATCSRNGYGIAFSGESTGIIRHSTCANNQRSGVWIGESAQVDVVNSTIEKNGGAGIFLQLDAAGGEIRDNALSENNLALTGSDIEIWGIFAPELARNRCSDDTSGPSPFGGDLDGIVFMWLGQDLPDPSVSADSKNDCATAICTGVSMFDMTCESP